MNVVVYLAQCVCMVMNIHYPSKQTQGLIKPFYWREHSPKVESLVYLKVASFTRIANFEKIKSSKITKKIASLKFKYFSILRLSEENGELVLFGILKL